LTKILALPARPRSGGKSWRENLHRYHRSRFFGASDRDGLSFRNWFIFCVF
jgi:hypothetical protein